MYIVGLTGGIGSGKTTIAKLFTKKNIPTYYADEAAKRLMNTSSELRQQIQQEFGTSIYLDNKLDKKRLANIIFGDSKRLETLNTLVHPAVQKDFNKWIQLQNSIYVIREAAILFESGSHKDCDATIVVTAPKDIRIARVISRDRCSKEDVLQRMQHQYSDDQKIKLSNYVIYNIDLKSTKMIVESIHKDIILKIQPKN